VLLMFLKLERLSNSLGGMCEQACHVEPPFPGVPFHSHQNNCSLATMWTTHLKIQPEVTRMLYVVPGDWWHQGNSQGGAQLEMCCLLFYVQ
jgi:hypothetical protein